MIWILIVIAIVAIIMIVDLKRGFKQDGQESKNAAVESQKHIQECANNLNEKWALCISKFVLEEHYREPCIVRIVAQDGKRTALRIQRKSTEIEQLFEVTDEEANESGSYQWSGKDQNGAFKAILIDEIDEDETEEHPKAECELSISNGAGFDFYIVIGFMTDGEEAIKLINRQ